MKKTRDIRDFYNRKIGSIETDTNTGDETARDFYGRILGYYIKKQDVTQDFYHRILYRGNMLSSLITEEDNKRGR